ncbi:MAG: sensor histidine kinase, partial [Gaiellaceae bacterium]
MSGVRHITEKYWPDILIVLLGVSAMLEVYFGQERPGSGAPTTTLWFCLPALAVLAALVLLRRRFPFGGPFAYWVVAASYSFVDRDLTPFPISLFVIGMASAFLLGNLRNRLQAGLGLAAAVAGSGLIVFEIPGHSTAQMLFIPLQFAISWVAGFALRERSEQAEAAELRATVAERERDAAARIAVAEERARIARELHDIVA